MKNFLVRVINGDVFAIVLVFVVLFPFVLLFVGTVLQWR